jgi:uncharacterized protein (TIGR02647 family)
MSFTPELVAELEVLALFDLESTLEGLKIHQHAAPKKSRRRSACLKKAD